MSAWPADNVSRRSVAKLVPYARNARTHSPQQVDQIAAAIRQWGWTTPILIDETDNIIAGHGRVLAAQKLDIQDVPVMVARGWTEAQKKAYILADNKLALNAGWDNDLLKLELADLKLDGFDLELIGFDTKELELLLLDATAGLTDPDDVPDAENEAISALGDIWIMGRHRLMCGDSTDAVTVENVLVGVKPHLMVTDPPYGVEYEAGWRVAAGRTNPSMNRPKTNDQGAVGKVKNDDRADWSEAWALFSGDVAYVWHSGTMCHTVADSLIASGLEIRAQVMWSKSNFAISRGHYHPQHEPCFYAVRKGATGHWHGDRKQSTVWQIPKPAKSETGHSTQKPIECMKRPIENNSSPGQAVYEPFSGSGTTIIAAEMTGRCCYAIELNPTYVDVAIRRWQNFSGQSAILEATGESFATVESNRTQTKAA